MLRVHLVLGYYIPSTGMSSANLGTVTALFPDPGATLKRKTPQREEKTQASAHLSGFLCESYTSK